MKILTVVMRIFLTLILVMPLLGATGVFPAPTAEMYSAPEGWAFMSALMAVPYFMPMIGLLCLVCLILSFTGRMALAMILLAPFTVNVMLFHFFLDATPISAAAIPAYILLVTNAFFLWKHRDEYKPLLRS